MRLTIKVPQYVAIGQNMIDFEAYLKDRFDKKAKKWEGLTATEFFKGHSQKDNIYNNIISETRIE